MKVLLFFLGVSFFLIFFMFSFVGGVDGGVLGNSFLEANLYVFFSIICIFFVLKNEGYVRKQDSDVSQEVTPLSGVDVRLFVANFFSNYVYYIAGGLFYAALYFILLAFFPNTSISGVFLFINIIVLGLYFLESRFDVFQDFIGVNMVVIVLYYIGKHILYLVGYIDDFSGLELINILFVFVFFFIVLYHKKDFTYSGIIEGLLLGFVFLEIIVLYKTYMGIGLVQVSLISFVLGLILLVLTDPISYGTRIQKNILRSWGVLFLSLFAFIGTIGAFIGLNYTYPFFFIFLISGVVLFLFHQRFISHIALVSSVVSFSSALTLAWLFVLGEETGKTYLFLLYIASSMLLFSLPKNYIKTNSIYPVHVLSLFVNMLGVFFFFFSYDFSILSLGIFFFFESMYLFSSYYIFSKKK